jgi:arylsulfatase A-like enzyme
VTVVWMYIFPNGRVSNVWDNHAGYGIHGAKTGYDLLRSPVCIPPLDRAYAALLDDLAERGLLDDTLVVAAGEFGRTPKINGDQGRDHWGACQSVLFAGGGIQGGQVYGVSDSVAAYPKDNPVSPEDFLATIYHGVGISPEAEIRDRSGRPYRVVEGKPILKLF